MEKADRIRFARYLVGELFWEFEQHERFPPEFEGTTRDSVEVLAFQGYDSVCLRVGGILYCVYLTWNGRVPPTICPFVPASGETSYGPNEEWIGRLKCGCWLEPYPYWLDPFPAKMPTYPSGEMAWLPAGEQQLLHADATISPLSAAGTAIPARDLLPEK